VKKPVGARCNLQGRGGEGAMVFGEVGRKNAVLTCKCVTLVSSSGAARHCTGRKGIFL